MNMKETDVVKLLPAWQRVVFATSGLENITRFRWLLPALSCEPVWCYSVRDVMSALSVHDIAIVICSASLADGTFHDLFRVLDLARWHVPVIVAFAVEQPEQQSEATWLGACGCVTPQSGPREINRILSHALVESYRLDGLQKTTEDSSLWGNACAL
jgi:DNA-binding NtrC family response regulator